METGTLIQDKPVEGKPIEAHPIAEPPIQVHPIAGKPVEGKPIEAHPVDVKPILTKPVEESPVKAGSPADTVKPDEAVASIAGVIAGRAYNSGVKNPVITAQQVRGVLDSPSFAATLSAETLAQAHTLLGSSQAVSIIANAKAVALQVVRARLTLSKRESSAASSTATKAASPTAAQAASSATTLTPEKQLIGESMKHTVPDDRELVDPVHTGQKGRNLV